MPSELAKAAFSPCRPGDAPLDHPEIEPLLGKLGGKWQVVDHHHLEKEFKFKDFRQALAFTNRVGELAEQLNHHPDIHLAWGKVRLVIWTHSIGGLCPGDFVFAARADALQQA
jgi:4a-hydroxytetrahydrobiopterin dehydratase